jgi:DNA-binding PadR family transcriptional regulator
MVFSRSVLLPMAFPSAPPFLPHSSYFYVHLDILRLLLYYVKVDIERFSDDIFGRDQLGERKPVEYVILAGLVRTPRSGYDLTQWMQRETSHYFTVGHNRVYPALSELERDGLVVHKVVPSDRGPERKVYSITEAGREALLSWVDSPPIERQVRDEQLVKVLCYGFLPTERALARLEEIKTLREEKLARYEGYRRGLEVELREGRISEKTYLGTLLTLRRGIGAERSYVEWCEEAKEVLSSSRKAPESSPDSP